jgi:hypothetical protein
MVLSSWNFFWEKWQQNFMPRKARIDAPGALQHIIARGIERRKILQIKADYTDFLE